MTEDVTPMPSPTDDATRPPINPETRRVTRGMTPEEVTPNAEGVISQNAPVWEGGDPGEAVIADYAQPNRADVDQTYWHEGEADAPVQGPMQQPAPQPYPSDPTLPGNP
jgi:hypothetical protein